MRRKVFLLVPSDSPAGPIKGAYALANALAGTREVVLVFLKNGPGAEAALDSRVRRVFLSAVAKSLIGRMRAYSRLLSDAGGRVNVASLSMCFSADMVNMFCRHRAVIFSSVRGNLLVNYRHDYGALGVFLAMFHLACLRWYDCVVAMNRPMAALVRNYSRRKPEIIGNFVDECPLEKWRSSSVNTGALRFVFIGALSSRKQPGLLLAALRQLRIKNVVASIDIVGTGPLLDLLEAEAARLDLLDSITFWGFVDKPAELLSKADAMVLPSLSEGTSRAALEALHLGVPCVLRNVDGNAELIEDGENGTLFDADSELAAAMLRAAQMKRDRGTTTSLLPKAFRQSEASRRYMDLLDSIK